MPEGWLMEIEALAAKLAPLPGPDYALAYQSLCAAAFWLGRTIKEAA